MPTGCCVALLLQCVAASRLHAGPGMQPANQLFEWPRSSAAQTRPRAGRTLSIHAIRSLIKSPRIQSDSTSLASYEVTGSLESRYFVTHFRLPSQGSLVQLHSDLVSVALESGSGMRGCSFSLESSELGPCFCPPPFGAFRRLYSESQLMAKPTERGLRAEVVASPLACWGSMLRFPNRSLLLVATSPLKLTSFTGSCCSGSLAGSGCPGPSHSALRLERPHGSGRPGQGRRRPAARRPQSGPTRPVIRS